MTLYFDKSGYFWQEVKIKISIFINLVLHDIHVVITVFFTGG